MSKSCGFSSILASIPGAREVDSTTYYPARHRAGDTGLTLLVIDNPLGHAVIALQGAQVLEFKPAGSMDKLWLSPNAVLKPATPVRGGIPLCTPWFGPGPDGKSAHGFARVQTWTLVSAAVRSDGASCITLALAGDGTMNLLWPYPFEFQLAIVIGQSLELSFSAVHQAAQAAPLALVFHTYFPTSDISKACLRGLDGTTYIDKIDAGARKVQHGDVTISSVTDRIYLEVPAVQFLDCGSDSIRIESDTRCAVVWNAWTNDRNMPDLGEGTHAGYLCVERGDVADHAVMLEPGVSYCAMMRLT